MYQFHPPKPRTVLCLSLIELLCVIVIGYPLMHIYVFLRDDVEAVHRGFFCDDESLKHPFVIDRVRN